MHLAKAISVLTLVGCASGPVKEKADLVAQQKAKLYKKSIRSVPQSDIRGGACTRLAAKVKGQWDWKEAVETAGTCMQAKEYAKVEEIGNELATRTPAAPWGPYFLALAAREKGEIERATWMSELALKRAPDLGLLHYLKGQIQWTKKEFTPAVASFERSLELDNANWPAHLFLGQLYFRDQNYAKASKHFYEVLKSMPRHSIALSGLAESQIHENNPYGALDAYARLAETYPKDGQYLSRTAEIYENVLNDLPRALATYRNLRGQFKAGRVQKNVDPEIESKIKELEIATRDSRSVATQNEKGGKSK
jgi:tetratricopeptide (TPR) repeat protein